MATTTKQQVRLFTQEEYDAKEVELKEMEADSKVTDIDGNRWIKGWDDMWRSPTVNLRVNSTALVAYLNQVEVGPGGSHPLF